jgi:ABC-type transporter Mla maintaining outer membrane lipid asymmetry ATPase subunit MlaF
MKEGQIYWIGTPQELEATKDQLLRDFIEGNAQDD